MKALLDRSFKSKMRSISEKVHQMGYSEVAEEFSKLITSKDDKDPKERPIPLLYDNFMLSFDKENPIHLFFIHKRFLDFNEKTGFHAKEVEMIEKELGINKMFNEKKIKKLSDELGYPRNRIFTPEILECFKNENGIFLTKKFTSFIHTIMRIQLALQMIYSSDPFIEQFITEEKLLQLINNYSTKIKALSPLQGKYDWYKEFYSQIVASRFLFALSPLNDTKINIKSLVSSNLFLKFINMDNLPLENNPLSIKQTTEIYNIYVGLDSQQQGLLTQQDIKTLDGFLFTDAFTNRLMEIVQTFGEEIDFGLFLQIFYPLRNMHTLQGTHFFFKILALDSEEYISRHSINYFYKAMIKESQIEDHDFDSFLSKLFDIVGCKDEFITEDILYKSESQDLFFKLLIDIKTFKDWEVEEEEKTGHD